MSSSRRCPRCPAIVTCVRHEGSLIVQHGPNPEAVVVLSRQDLPRLAKARRWLDRLHDPSQEVMRMIPDGVLA